MPSLFSAKFVMVGLRSPAASLYSGSLVSEARRRTHPPGTLCGPICTSAEIKRRKLAGRLSTIVTRWLGTALTAVNFLSGCTCGQAWLLLTKVEADVSLSHRLHHGAPRCDGCYIPRQTV
jgi:hypothetical protein